MREPGNVPLGLTLSKLPIVWNRFATPTTDDAGQQSLVFGGYRWKSDIAVEAAFNSRENYKLSPGTLGLSTGGSLGLSDPATRVWNADVYTSWEFVRSLSLYGRLGYVQNDVRPLLQNVSAPIDVRRLRDGVNYGVGLRYDMSRALGLRVEYSRFNRYAGETAAAAVGVLPESDQLTIGVQFRF